MVFLIVIFMIFIKDYIFNSGMDHPHAIEGTAIKTLSFNNAMDHPLLNGRY